MATIRATFESSDHLWEQTDPLTVMPSSRSCPATTNTEVGLSYFVEVESISPRGG